MYHKSAEFYDALYHFRDYKLASENLKKIIFENFPSAKNILDTACGTGKHMEHIRNFFDIEGLDVSEELLEIARQRCPENVFHLESMIDFDLKKKYDVITCLFGSIAYVKTIDNFYKTISTMSNHLNSGGLLIVEPWFSKENFWVDHLTANHFDKKDLKITWMYTSKKVNDQALLDINYLVGTPEEVAFFQEKHELGLFDDALFRDAMHKAGLDVKHQPDSLFGKGLGNGLYIGIKR